MAALHRVIDANANRAREALRVLEDSARFHLNDPAITQELKALRHELTAVLRQLPAGILTANRDTSGDVGTAISTPTESTRSGYAAVIDAAASRLTEALRSIEEALKVLNAAISSQVESIRYRSYTAVQFVQRRMSAGAGRQWRICVLITEAMCRLPWIDVVRLSLAAGADCIQLREKELDGGEIRDRARRIVDLAGESGASVIVNDRVDVALAAGAHGVHLGQTDLTIDDVRRIAGRSLLVGQSTHSLAEARAAADAGADYCGVGAMFATSVKPERSPSGPDYLQQFIQNYPAMPHLAIGGITPENVGMLRTTGCQGVAVSRVVCQADRPDDIVARLRREWP